MPNAKKQSIVASFVAQLKDHPTVVLTEYKGSTHQQLEALRAEIKNKGGAFHVVKNSLIAIALKEAKLISGEFDVTGPSAAVLTGSDNFAPLKALYEKGKEFANLKIKLGLWNGRLITGAEVINLATLPSKEELIAKLVGQLKTPETKLVMVLKGNLQKLIVALNQIREKKSVVN